MENRRVLVVMVALAAVTAAVGVPIVGAAASQATGTPTEPETAPMGTQVSAFMQHSAAQANDSVDDGMWQAAFERANESERARLATERARTLGSRVDHLQEEREQLRVLRDNGTISQAEYVARVSELNGRIDALDESVNGTERAAERAGLDVEGLETLKRNASTLSGQEVAGIARGLASGDRGPPDDAGPPTDANAPTDAGPLTDAGPPGDPPTPDAPDHANNGTDGPSGNGPPDNAEGNDPGGGDDPGGDGPPDGGNGGNEQGESDGYGDGPGQGSGSGGDDNPGQGNGPSGGNGPGQGNGQGQGNDAGQGN